MKQARLVFFFLFLNFGGLMIGNWLMQSGPTTDWYINLNKAPWTPSGWVFGTAWTLIMICFSIYLGKLFSVENTQKMKIIFLIQFILNVSWNFIFFNQQLVLLALIAITLLTALLFIYFFKLSNTVGLYKYLLLPYIIWLCIATSLNLYILVHN